MSAPSGFSVLLVEDNPGERWLFSEILRSRGHTVTACERGDEALQAFARDHHELIMLDLMLPGLSGLEVCSRIRAAKNGDQPVILVVTSKSEPDVLGSVLDAGANDYVSKPVDIAVLNIRLAVAERAVVMKADRLRAREELEAKSSVSGIAMQTKNFKEAGQLLARLSETTGFPVVVIEMYEEARNAMLVVASHGLPQRAGDEAMTIRLADTLTGRAIETRQSVVAVDPHAREHKAEYFRSLKLKTLIAVPLVVGTEVLGALVLCHPEPVGIAERKLTWIEGLADAVASFTERVRAAADLREREASSRLLAEELQRANDELEGFAYSVSHDLRAPLRTMTGFAHALVEDHGEQLSADARDFAQRIITSGRRAEGLISDLLGYSRLTFETLELQPVELGEVIEAVTEQLSNDIAERGARIEVEGDLPNVLAVNTILTQVLSNLVSNAIKFVPKEREPIVSIRAEQLENRVRIWVEDNGIGVPEGQEERVFKVFERLSDNQGVPGNGIGLAIVRRGMERIGGAAGLERKESGSAFWIEIQEGRSQVWRPFSLRG